MKTVIKQLDTAIQQALNEPEPHDYYERLVVMEGLVKKLISMLPKEPMMQLSRRAYQKGHSDALGGDAPSSPYSKDDDRNADYSIGFVVGLREYQEL